jgi:hypothetical protein
MRVREENVRSAPSLPPRFPVKRAGCARGPEKLFDDLVNAQYLDNDAFTK